MTFLVGVAAGAEETGIVVRRVQQTLDGALMCHHTLADGHQPLGSCLIAIVEQLYECDAAIGEIDATAWPKIVVGPSLRRGMRRALTVFGGILAHWPDSRLVVARCRAEYPPGLRRYAQRPGYLEAARRAWDLTEAARLERRRSMEIAHG